MLSVAVNANLLGGDGQTNAPLFLPFEHEANKFNGIRVHIWFLIELRQA